MTGKLRQKVAIGLVDFIYGLGANPTMRVAQTAHEEASKAWRNYFDGYPAGFNEYYIIVTFHVPVDPNLVVPGGPDWDGPPIGRVAREDEAIVVDVTFPRVIDDEPQEIMRRLLMSAVDKVVVYCQRKSIGLDAEWFRDLITAFPDGSALRERRKAVFVSPVPVKESVPGPAGVRRFWKVVDEARRRAALTEGHPRDALVEAWESVLNELDDQQILEVTSVMKNLRAKMNSAKLWAAASSLSDPLSDDVYEYLLLWLIMSGQDAYAAIRKNPRRLHELQLKLDDILVAEDFSIALQDVWEARHPHELAPIRLEPLAADELAIVKAGHVQ